jgi:GTP-binding protein
VLFTIIKTNVLNATLPLLPHEPHSAMSASCSLPQARIDKFEIEPDPQQLPGGSRLFYIRGEALERFAQMTNWDYYEAVKRFQRVLEVSGINAALKEAGGKFVQLAACVTCCCCTA